MHYGIVQFIIKKRVMKMSRVHLNPQRASFTAFTLARALHTKLKAAQYAAFELVFLIQL